MYTHVVAFVAAAGLKPMGRMDECDSADVGWRCDYYVNYKHCLATFLVIVMAC